MVHEISLTGYRAGYCGTRGMLSLGTWGSYGREQLHISTDASWEGLVVTVHFCTGTGVTPVLVGADGLVDVPPEATASPGMGNIVVDGTADGQRIYSVNVPYIVLNHADVDGAEPPPTPDKWEQYVAQVKQYADAAAASADEAAQNANAAEESAQAAKESASKAAGAVDSVERSKDAALKDLQAEGDKQQSAIAGAGTAAIEAIGTARTQGTAAVQQAQTSGVEAIQTAQNAGVQAVQTAGQTQQTAIEQAGQGWQQQIEAAGTAELGRWAPAIWDIDPLAAEHDIYAAKGAPLRVTQQGQTQQETTTGAQLLPPQLSQAAQQNGVTFEPLADGRLHVYGTATADASVTGTPRVSLAAEAYTLDIGVEREQEKFRVCLTDAAGAPYLDVADGERARTQTLDAPVQVSLLVRVFAGQAVDLTLSPMLCAGSTALPWEPYTGGKPSPSPDYQQEIKGTGLNGKIVLDGSQNYGASNGNGWGGIYTLGVYAYLKDDQKAVSFGCFSERFPERNALWNVDYEGVFVNSVDTNNYVSVRIKKGTLQKYGKIDTDDDIKATFKAYFAANPLPIYYHAANGTDYTVGTSTEDTTGDYSGQEIDIGSPLYGDDGVVDEVSNDVSSGCDKVIIVDGAMEFTETGSGDNRYWNLPDGSTPGGVPQSWCMSALGGNVFYTSNDGTYAFTMPQWAPQFGSVDELNAYCKQMAAEGTPLKIWYKSTSYTEDADLRIDKITRRWKIVELDGSEAWEKTGQVVVDEWVLEGVFAPYTLKPARSSHFTYTNLQQIGSFYINAQGSLYIRFASGEMATVSDLTAWLAAQKAAGTPVRVLYQLETPEVYAADPHTLPALGALPEIVKATGESTVSYSADTKHYIDSKLQAAITPVNQAILEAKTNV